MMLDSKKIKVQKFNIKCTVQYIKRRYRSHNRSIIIIKNTPDITINKLVSLLTYIFIYLFFVNSSTYGRCLIVDFFINNNN